MSVMFCTRATSVKEKCLEATIVSFETAGLHFLTFRHCRRFGGFIVNFEHILHFCSSVSIVNFEQVNAGWDTRSEILSLTSVTLSHINDVIVVPFN